MKAILLFLAAATVASADSISVYPGVSNVTPGQTFTVTIDIDSGVTDLDAFQFSLLFDPTILQAVSVTEGDLFSATGNSDPSSTVVDNVAGNTGLFGDLIFGDGVGGPGAIASVEFQAIAPGSSTINFDTSGDANTLLLFDSNFNPIDATVNNASVNVIAPETPEPATWVLFAPAGAMLYLWRRRFSR